MPTTPSRMAHRCCPRPGSRRSIRSSAEERVELAPWASTAWRAKAAKVTIAAAGSIRVESALPRSVVAAPTRRDRGRSWCGSTRVGRAVARPPVPARRRRYHRPGRSPTPPGSSPPPQSSPSPPSPATPSTPARPNSTLSSAELGSIAGFPDEGNTGVAIRDGVVGIRRPCGDLDAEHRDRGEEDGLRRGVPPPGVVIKNCQDPRAPRKRRGARGRRRCRRDSTHDRGAGNRLPGQRTIAACRRRYHPQSLVSTAAPTA